MKKDHNLNRCSSLCTKVGLLLIGFLPNTAFSLPAGGDIKAGYATITSDGSDNVLNVNQSSENLFIDWDSFDIDTDETVNFIQKSHYIALNRISNSGQLTTINGNLNANGSVFIINPNGVLINGNVDTNSFIATTAGIDPDDFINNANADFAFTEAGELDSSVETGLDSKISVSENGKAILVAPTVKNAGLIEGKIIQLAAADSFSIDFDGDGLLSFELSTPDTQSRSLLNENIGTLRRWQSYDDRRNRK
jgi:filamentous hemagglutinin family protein